MMIETAKPSFAFNEWFMERLLKNASAINDMMIVE